MAFGVWYVEKEFHVGPITDEYPLMKFFNLLDQDNIKRYKEIQEQNMPSKTRTIG